jgi:hypothetical protein
MNRFIFGFQRRVWCPKWTPLSRSWRMVTTAMGRYSYSVRRVARVDGAAGATTHLNRQGLPDRTVCPAPYGTAGGA